MSVWRHFCLRFLPINQGKFPLWWIWPICTYVVVLSAAVGSGVLHRVLSSSFGLFVDIQAWTLWQINTDTAWQAVKRRINAQLNYKEMDVRRGSDAAARANSKTKKWFWFCANCQVCFHGWWSGQVSHHPSLIAIRESSLAALLSQHW